MKHGIAVALSVFVAAASTQSLPALADERQASTGESTGLVGGLAIGAALGGPPGAILGAAAGGWFGSQWTTRHEYQQMQAELEQTQQQLVNSQAINGALQQRQLVLHQQLTNSQLLASTEKANSAVMCCTENEVVLHFRSASYTIEPHYRDALLRFVDYSAAHPERAIEISGFADREGDNAENLFLSQRRVESAVKILREMGLGGATFKTVAYGEREPVSAAASDESNFFDRRVVLRLSGENQSLLSSAGH